MKNPLQNTDNHNLRSSAQKSRKADLKVEGGVNPYRRPDRKKTIFYDSSKARPFLECVVSIFSLPVRGRGGGWNQNIWFVHFFAPLGNEKNRV